MRKRRGERPLNISGRTADAADLEQLFADLAANISKTGATNIVIHEVVTADFVITSITPPGQGSAMQLDDASLRWTIPALGVSASESATLEFFVRHVGNTPGWSTSPSPTRTPRGTR